MTEATFTFRVDEELKKAFAAAAREEDRTGAQILRGLMRDYVQKRKEAAEYEAWFREQVRIGLDDVAAGRVVSHEEVTAEFAERKAAIRRKPGAG